MDLQERKIHFVQEFLKLKSEEIIHKLEDTLKLEKTKIFSGVPVPYTMVEFNEKIDKAEEDVKNGRVRTTDQLKEDMKSWG
jgi:hypothetical protein